MLDTLHVSVRMSYGSRLLRTSVVSTENISLPFLQGRPELLDQAKLLTKLFFFFFLEWLRVSNIVISDDLQDVRVNNLKIILSPLF